MIASQHVRRGITLVELLVALGLASMMIVSLYYLWSNFSTRMEITRARQLITQDVRKIRGFLQSDFASMEIRSFAPLRTLWEGSGSPLEISFLRHSEKGPATVSYFFEADETGKTALFRTEQSQDQFLKQLLSQVPEKLSVEFTFFIPDAAGRITTEGVSGLKVVTISAGESAVLTDAQGDSGHFLTRLAQFEIKVEGVIRIFPGRPNYDQPLVLETVVSCREAVGEMTGAAN